MSYASKILGIGGYVPPKIYTNKDIEKMLDTSDEWIIQRTGIEQRHWCDSKTSTSDLAYEASIIAIEKAGIKKEDIDLIIFATLSPDHEFPGTACFLQTKLGIPGIAAFDIRQQCSGFLYGLSMADKFIKAGDHKNILLVGAEVHSKGLNQTPEGRDVSVLFGDGAGAVIVSRTEVSDSKKEAHVMTTDLHADGTYAKELWIPAPGTGFESTERMDQNMLDELAHYPKMNGRLVFAHAVKKMCETLQHSLDQMNLTMDEIDILFFHQANLRINSKVAEVMKIPEEKVFNTIQKYGNTTAATIPLGMHDAFNEGVLRPGMLVASAAFGSGFTWGSAIFRF